MMRPACGDMQARLDASLSYESNQGVIRMHEGPNLGSYSAIPCILLRLLRASAKLQIRRPCAILYCVRGTTCSLDRGRTRNEKQCMGHERTFMCTHRPTLRPKISAAGWAGKQAEVLNVVLEDVLHAHPISEQRMKEVLGHTPLQARSGPSSMRCTQASFMFQRHCLTRTVTYPNVAIT